MSRQRGASFVGATVPNGCLPYLFHPPLCPDWGTGYPHRCGCLPSPPATLSLLCPSVHLRASACFLCDISLAPAESGETL